MNVEIFPTKKLPPIQSIDGDYCYTQSALILSMMADGETVLKNCNKSIDTERTVDFMRSLGCSAGIENNVVRINSDGKLILPDSRMMVYDGELYPLSIIIGLLAGLNKSFSLQYSKRINQDMIDRIIETFNKNGIDLFHEADSRTIIIRSATDLPVKTKLHTSNSCEKNSLLMFGVSSGIPVVIREMAPAAAHLESVAGQFGISLEINEPGSKLIEDPDDPRRKIRVAAADYSRELVLSPGTEVRPAELSAPFSSDTISSFLTLAVLLKKEIILDNVLLNSERMKFLDHLKAIGSEVIIRNRKSETGLKFGTITVHCKNIKARKFAGEHTSVLIDNVPFMALMAVPGSGTTIIRGVSEFNEWGVRPLQEIAENFERMGVKCGILEDGLIIEGTGEVNGADFGPFKNRKIALIFYLAALVGQGVSTFSGFESISEYYPDFASLTQGSIGSRTIARRGA